jgi:hypothetical protein
MNDGRSENMMGFKRRKIEAIKRKNRGHQETSLNMRARPQKDRLRNTFRFRYENEDH